MTFISISTVGRIEAEHAGRRGCAEAVSGRRGEVRNLYQTWIKALAYDVRLLRAKSDQQRRRAVDV